MKTLDLWWLDNGLRVVYQRDPAFPLASATLFLKVGSRSEGLKEAGLCSMSVDLLMQGTRHRTARELATLMESVGASMGTQVHEDYSEMGFIVPATELTRAFGIMAEVLKAPSFPQHEILKEKAHILAGLSSRKDAIFNLAYDSLTHSLYGNHPYGRPLEGLPKTVQSFKRMDFQRWHRQRVRPENGVLSLSGPWSVKDVARGLQTTLGTWRAAGDSKASLRLLPVVKPLERSASRVVRSTFEQAYLMTGWQAPNATHANHIPLKVLNTLLGGGMSSRLFAILREEFGLAYEVSSFYPTRLDKSHWVIYLGLPKEKLAKASQELEKLLGEIVRRGPLSAEVKQAKAMIRGAFLMDRQSHRRQSWYAGWWEFLGRGQNYGEEFLKAVDAVTPQQLHTLIQRMFKQPRVTITVVPK